MSYSERGGSDVESSITATGRAVGGPLAAGRAMQSAPHRPTHRPATGLITAARDSGELGEGCAVTVAAGAIYLAVAWAVAEGMNLRSAEAMERAVSAWFLLLGDLGRISIGGSTEPPLPALLEMPLALLPSLRGTWLSGAVLSAASGALACLVLGRILAALGASGPWRLAAVALFALNPLVLFQAASGSSEMIGVLMVLLSAHYLIDWHRTQNLQPLISLGFATGGAALARFDAAAYAIVLVGVLWYLDQREDEGSAGRTPGILAGYGAPVLFLTGAWVLFSLLIPDGPARVGEAAVRQVVGWGYAMGDAVGSSGQAAGQAAGSLGDVLPMLAQLSPLFLLSVGLVLRDSTARREKHTLCLILLGLCSPALLVLRAVAGDSVRLSDAILMVPFGFVLAGRALAPSPLQIEGTSARTTALRALVVLTAALSSLSTLAAMAGPLADREERAFAAAGSSQGPGDLWIAEREIAAYLTANVGGSLVLADLRDAYPIVFFTRSPELFRPIGSQRAPDPAREAERDPEYLLAMSKRPGSAPGMAAGDYPGTSGESPYLAVPVKEWPAEGWRLYRLIQRNDSAGR